MKTPKKVIFAISYLLIFVTFLISNTSQAEIKTKSKTHRNNQLNFKRNKYKYLGLQFNYGIKTFQLKSNIPSLNNQSLVKDGGSLGIIYGDHNFRMTANLVGIYSTGFKENISSSFLEVNAMPQILLLNPKKNRFNVYAGVGVSYQKFLVFGRHVKSDEANYTHSFWSDEPMLGSVNKMNIDVSLGAEYKLVNRADFLNIFIEGRQSNQMSSSFSSIALNQTQLTPVTSFNLGFRLGKNR